MYTKPTGNCAGKITIGFFLYAAVIFLSGCQKTDINFGSQFVDNSYTQIIKIDTVSTLLQTRFYDSIPTGGTGICVAGSYKDPAFGTVTAATYLKIAPPAYNVDSNYNTSTYDSIVLVLRPNGHYYGDTTKPVHLNVYQLVAPFQTTYNNNTYYNVDSIARNPVSVGGTDFIYYPHNQNSDSCRIKLSDALGHQLFSMLQAKDTRIQNTANFQTFFNGLSIGPGNSPSSCIFDFNDSIYVRLYFTSPGTISAFNFKDFRFTDKTNQFNNIAIQRTGALASAAATPDVHYLVNSSVTGNASYLQSTTGTDVKVSFPSIRNILQLPYFLRVIKAQLILKPVLGTYSYIYPLPDSLRLTQTDIYNNSLGDLTGSTGGAQIGSLSVDYLYGQNTQYTFDVTGYVNNLLAISADNAYGLVASPPLPLFSTRFDRVVFDNSSNTLVNTQLLVFYITFQ
jgi:hypothetical protein